MATIEIVSIDSIEDDDTASCTVKVTIGDEEFVQQILGVPTKTATAAKGYLQNYATEYETGLADARAAQAAADDPSSQPIPDGVPKPIANLVGQPL